MRFGAYAPQNLDRGFLGPITARTALQASRNLPAVALLDAVGPGAAPRPPAPRRRRAASCRPAARPASPSPSAASA